MAKKPGLLPGRNRKDYWGILAPAAPNKPFHKPTSYISLLEVPKQDTALPVEVKVTRPVKRHGKLSLKTNL